MRCYALIVVLFAFVGAQTDEGTDMQGGECKTHFRHKGAVMMANDELGKYGKMFKGFSKSCLDIKPPKTLTDIAKKCGIETAKTSAVAEELKRGDIPDLDSIGQLVDSFLTCKMNNSGVKITGTQIDKNSLQESHKFSTWEGEDVQLVTDFANKCMDSLQGETPIQQYTNNEKCIVYSMIDECKKRNDDPGFMLLFTAKILAINSNDTCSTVKVPNEVNNMAMDCLNEVQTNLAPTPEKIENETDLVKKMKKMAKRFFVRVLFNTTICIQKKQGLFNESANEINVPAYANWVKGLDGWEKIPEKRDLIYETILKCGNESNSMFSDSSHFSPSQSSTEEEDDGRTEDRIIKRLMKTRLAFDKCFSPVFTKECGMKNDIIHYMYPMFNKEFATELSSAFIEMAGGTATMVLEMLKRKFEGKM